MTVKLINELYNLLSLLDVYNVSRALDCIVGEYNHYDVTKNVSPMLQAPTIVPSLESCVAKVGQAPGQL